MSTKIQVRRGTAAQWTAANPTLAEGEIGFETNTGKFKIGTGSLWNALLYATDTSEFVGRLSGANGGTGVANTGKTITLGGNLTTSGAFATTLISTAATNVTLPTTGTLATTAQIQPKFSPFVSGAYYKTALPSSIGSIAMTLNTTYYAPFYVGATTTFSEISIQIFSVTTGGTVRLGIFNDTGNYAPGSVSLDAGTVSTATNGVKAITISKILTPGWYWLASNQQSGNVTGYSTVGGSAFFDNHDQRIASSSNHVNSFSYQQAGVTGAFATASPGTILANAVPVVVLKVA